ADPAWRLAARAPRRAGRPPAPADARPAPDEKRRPARSGCRPGRPRAMAVKPVLVLHGGAGRRRRDAEAAQRAGLARALEAGWSVLARGGSSLDAVTAAVVALEDDPGFNAGRGAVATAEGRYELDASIMDGATRRAGAVAAVATLRNPILAARAVMEHSPHVLLAGPGAARFARAHGLAFAPASGFARARRDARTAADAAPGTVGAVARDRDGHLAAATSTGGTAGKLPGRVGDSPIVGAGTWVDDRTCAVSGTGDGERFVRAALPPEVPARMRHCADSLAPPPARPL